MSSIACRTGAVLAVGSAVLHGFSLTSGHRPVIVVLTVAMAAVCLYCAAELWTRGTERAWVLAAVMNLAMIGVHLPLSGHHHGAAVAGAGSSAMAAATLIAVLEVGLATVVLAVRSRRYAPRLPDAM